MEFIINNWLVILVAIVAVIMTGIFIFKFAKATKEEQIKSVKEWLLWAVTEAEKEFGSGTGKLKLRFVYDMFVNAFPWLSKVISFDAFSEMVDEVLVEMNKLLADNNAVRNYVEGNDNA